jgi:putative PEP-CTERM system TPR-repeat lipoprotein
MIHSLRLSLGALLACVLVLPALAQQDDPASTETPTAKSAAEFYEKALVAHNLGDARSAYIYLKNALKDDPQLLSAHLLLGKIYLSLGQGERAEEQLLIADGLGAHRSLTQNSLARAYLMQGKAQQLIDELFPMGSVRQEDAELLALRGEAHLELEQLFEAQRSFTQAWEMDPRSAGAILGRVRVMLLQGELERASALVREAVEVAPRHAQAWFMKGTLADNVGDYIGALSDFNKAVELLPAYLPAQIARVNLLLRLRRTEDAAEAVVDIKEIYPNDPRSHFLEAVVEMRLGNSESAEAALSKARDLIVGVPRELIEDHPPTLLLAGLVSFNLKQWQQAEGYLNQYLAEESASTGARVLLARMELEQQNEPEKAIQLLEPAVRRTPDNIQALSILAEAYMKTDQHLKATGLLREASERRGSDPLLRAQRAVNEFGLGRRDSAIEELVSVIDLRPNMSNAGATLVIMLMQQRDYDAAVKAARDLLLRVPDHLSYINLFGTAASANGELDAAQWAFEFALALDPTFYPARENLAELLLRRGNTVLARGHLGRVMETSPGNLGALMLLARTYEAEGDLQQALRLAEQALDEDPAAVDVAVYKTELLLRMGESDKAVRVAEGIEVRAQNPDDSGLLVALARAYIASGQRATAQVVLTRASSLAGYNARELQEVATLQREAGDLEGALWSLKKATDGEPDFLPTRIKLGELLVQIGRIQEAVPLAQALADDYPDAPYADHLMGLIFQRQGQDAAAFERFSAAIAKRPSALLALRAYEAKRDAEGLAAGVAFLEQWQKQDPGDDVIAQALAEGYYGLGYHEKARQLFEQRLAQSPDNPFLLNNLAVIYTETGDPRALDYAKRAYDLMPGAAEIGDTLGWVLVREGELNEGLKHLRDARSRAASDPGIGYHIAVALKGLGRTEEAINELVQVLQTAGDGFPEREQALRLLDELRAVRSAQSG